MPGSHKPIEYYVHVEELIPRVNVRYMLQLADNLEKLEPVESKIAFKDLKRSMAWMEKYIFPTSEFWEWTNDRFHLDAESTLTVQLLGFGWAVAISSRKPVTEADVSGEEKRLIDILNKLTQHIPVQAVLRIKSTPWTTNELREVAQMLCLNGIPCVANTRKFSLTFREIGLKITFEPEERLEGTCVSREGAKQIEHILALMREYANRNHEGAGWCAYQRRRLTLVHKIGSEKVSQKDLRFLKHPESGLDGEVLASLIRGPDEFLARFYFLRAKYHEGNIHPRALVGTGKGTDTLKVFTTYVYYLWNFHYSRIWLYLLFEDIYSYAASLRSSKQYVDPKIRYYWERLLKTDEIMIEMEIHERINSGTFQSYRPPHDKFREEDIPDAAQTPVKPLRWLKEFLIEATTTQLYEDPLKRAVIILKEIDEGMKKTLGLFVNTVDIRIQRTLHILQFLFIVSAVGALVVLLDLGKALIEILKHFGLTIPLIDPLPISLANLLLVTLFSVAVISLLRTAFVRRWIERVIK